MRKMNVIFVIFFVNRIVSAQESSDETKYIDLLPDKDKEEFLERIARRIFEGVQPQDDTDRVSGEVSETQLDEQDAFVKQILEEESLNLRKSDHKEDNDNVNEEPSEKKDSKDPVDDSELVDLTLRDGKRNKRNSLAKVSENSKIINVSVGDGDMNVPKEDADLTNADSDSDKSGLAAEDIQIKYFKRNKVENNNNLEITSQSSNSMITQVDDTDAVKSDSETIAPPDDNVDESLRDKSQETKDVNEYEHIGNNNIQSEGDLKEKSSFSEIIESTTLSEYTSPDVKPLVVITTEQYSNEINQSEDHINPNSRSLGKSANSEDTKDLEENNITPKDLKEDAQKVTVENFHDLPETKPNKETVEDLKTDNSDTISTTKEHTTENNDKVDSTTLESERPITAIVKPKHKEKESNSKELIASKEDSLKHINKQVNNYKEDVSPKELIDGEVHDNMLKNASKSENLETTSSTVKYTKTEDIKIENTEQPAKLDKQSYNMANDMIKVLKTEIIPDTNSDDTNFNGLRSLYEATKPKEYKVYEIPADKEPFLQKHHQEITNKENPYYVPIYNYSPDNAYYNAHNRLGPNADDDEEDIIINRDLNDAKNDDFDVNEREADNSDSENRDDNDVGSLGTNRESVDSGEQKHYDNIKNKESPIERLIWMLKNYKNQRKFRFGSAKEKRQKMIPYKLKMPVVVHYPKFTDIILNKNDYLDMDYYYGRSQHIPKARCDIDRKPDHIFPDSKEEDHPYNDMHAENNLKDHMRSVRKLLYKQKHFGYIAPPNNTESLEEQVSKEVLRTKINTRDKNYNENDKNIAMDYFFGRMDDDVNTETRTNKITYPRYPKKGRKTKRNKLKETRYRFPKGYRYDYIQPATPAYTYRPHYTPLRAKKKPNATDFATIKKILSISDESDLIITLDKLLKLNLTTRTNDEEDIESYVEVLENLVRNDAKGLMQYDWLSTTVDVQSALVKLMDMVEELQNSITIAEPDLQLLKYTIYLHKSTKRSEEKDYRRTKILPRNKKKRKGIITESGLLNRIWLIRMITKKHDTIITKEDLSDFDKFLNELQYYLYDLHTAIQQIGNITNYQNQRWFQNLKELYLKPKRKNLLEVLLHLTTTRLLDIIEESAKNGAEDDFLTYVMKNEKEVERAKTEFSFVLKIIDALKMEGI